MDNASVILELAPENVHLKMHFWIHWQLSSKPGVRPLSIIDKENAGLYATVFVDSIRRARNKVIKNPQIFGFALSDTLLADKDGVWTCDQVDMSHLIQIAAFGEILHE